MGIFSKAHYVKIDTVQNYLVQGITVLKLVVINREGKIDKILHCAYQFKQQYKGWTLSSSDWLITNSSYDASTTLAEH